MLAASARRSGERYGQWFARLCHGHMQLWMVWSDHCEAAVVTEVVTSQAEKTCNIVACGGTAARRWIHLLEKIEAWAAEHGCKIVRVTGRAGWERMLPDYRRTAVVLDKRLD